MRVILHSFQVPKAGNSEADCEDQFLPAENPTRRIKKFRCAVADGATESAFAGKWAELLVNLYVKPEGFKQEPTSATELEKIIKEKAPEWAKFVWGKPLPWFAQEKVQQGAFSTLLGLCLEDKSNSCNHRLWRALGVGDTCVFQVREESLIAHFPVERAEQFGNHPVLISTKPESNSVLPEHIHVCTKNWLPGDRFFLMTDALAHWFLNRVEESKKPWLNELKENAFADKSRFAEWIDSLRAARDIRNDDVTLLMIRVEK